MTQTLNDYGTMLIAWGHVAPQEQSWEQSAEGTSVVIASVLSMLDDFEPGDDGKEIMALIKDVSDAVRVLNQIRVKESPESPTKCCKKRRRFCQKTREEP